MKMINTLLATSLVVLVATSSTGFAADSTVSNSGHAVNADQTQSLPMDHEILTAKSKADHEELAVQYESEAKKLQAKADEHKEMLKAYNGTHWTEKHDLARHCKSLVQKYEDAAKDNFALAKIHRVLAEKTKGAP